MWSSRGPAGSREDNTLYEAGNCLRERTGNRKAIQSCPYTTSARHPLLTTALMVGAAATMAGLVQLRRR